MIKDLISVIIANYNNAKYLEQCLNSVLSQTYKKVEIVIADDCSTDNSRDILKKYASEYDNITLVLNEKNHGVTKNRHFAILKSQGEFITTLDADDYYYDSEKLQNEYNLLKHHKNNSNNDIIAFSNTILADENGVFIKFWYENVEIPEGNILETVFFRACVIPRDFLFLRTAYDLIGGYDTKIGIYEDYDLDIRLAKSFEFYYTGKPGVAYRQTAVGLSKSKRSIHLKWLIYIVKKNKNLLGRSKKYTNFRNYLYKSLVLNKIKSNELTLRLYVCIKKYF